MDNQGLTTNTTANIQYTQNQNVNLSRFEKTQRNRPQINSIVGGNI